MGDLAWTYDRIGNRLRETREGVTDTYAYLPNAALGNSAQLDEIQLGAGGTRTFAYDATGNQTQVSGSSSGYLPNISQRTMKICWVILSRLRALGSR